MIIQIMQPEGLDATINLPACVESSVTPGFGLRGVTGYEPNFSGGTVASECPGVVTVAPDGTFVFEAVGDPGVTGANALDEFDFLLDVSCPNGPVDGMIEGRVFLGPVEGGAPLSEAGSEQSLLPFLPLFVFLIDPPLFSAPPLPFCEVPQINIQIPDGGIVNGAGFLPGPLAPGSIVSVFGTGLSAGMSAAANSVPLPTVLEGVTVEVDGVSAPLFFSSQPQINFQIPDLSSQSPLTEKDGSRNQANTVTVVVKHSGFESNPAEIEIGPHSPAIFTADSGPGRAIAFDAISGPLAQPAGAFSGSKPIVRGGFLTIFATGLGETNPPIVPGSNSLDAVRRTVTLPTVTIGGVNAPVLFSGMSPQFVAVYQINIEVPSDAPTGDAVPLILEIGGLSTRDDVTIAVGE
jgi:uncharacterized protein (TIGR03437 family)